MAAAVAPTLRSAAVAPLPSSRATATGNAISATIPSASAKTATCQTVHSSTSRSAGAWSSSAPYAPPGAFLEPSRITAAAAIIAPSPPSARP